ncbi:Protein ABHD18 [Hondaea fermentalgiana]|uniref:Protein ABHD18 n=1 Tax=Hondaea fermentalgiana TaxID=2315210 RepID=A0A2R5G6R1_9STRA|nr:Protein ABHD18 [Hondaea fermentalgiana]|eukprot:GBG24133.1 Protein ABHD18 [Hondaea fermentalgiana]
MSAVFGFAGGLLDLGFGHVHSNKLLEKGWGEEILSLEADLNDLLVGEGSVPLRDISDFSYTNEGEPVQVAKFSSPCAEWLPEESKTGYAAVVKPPANIPLRAAIVLIPATGDVGFSARVKQVAQPLASVGVASILPQVPYYGRRKPQDQKSIYVRTFGEFLMQTTATIVEAAKLAKLAAALFPDVPLGLAGTSAGGGYGMAAYPSLLRELETVGEERPIAICTHVSTSRHMPMLTSVFGDLCDFDGLVDKDKPGVETVTAARARVRSVLEHRGVERYFRVLGSSFSPKDAAYTCVLAKHDRCVVPEEAMILPQVLTPYVNKARIVEVNGGHLTSIMRTSKVLPNNILETFGMLKAAPSFAKLAVRGLRQCRR